MLLITNWKLKECSIRSLSPCVCLCLIPFSSHTAPAAEAKKEEEPEAEESDEDMGFSEYRLVSTSYLVLIVYSPFYSHFCFICLWVKEKLLHMLGNLHEQDH